MKQKSNRNYGIDCLRLLAMLFIVTIHFCNHGGILESIKYGTIQYGASYLLFSVVNSGVDIFAVISGFVSYKEVSHKYNWTSIIKLWLTVTYYSVVLFCVMCILFPSDRNFNQFLIAITPIISHSYWYFSSYFIVFFMEPFVNEYIRNSNSNKLSVSMLLLTIFLYISHFIDGLFSIVLLLYLYFCGALIKRYNIIYKVSAFKCGIVLCFFTAFSFVWKLIFTPIAGDKLSGVFLRYDSPTLMLVAVCWVIIFGKIKVDRKCENIICKISPSIFSVYLINDNNLVRNHFIVNCAKMENRSTSYLFFVILLSLAFVIGSILVDQIRIRVFEAIEIDKKVCYITEVVERVAIKFNKLCKDVLNFLS